MARFESDHQEHHGSHHGHYISHQGRYGYTGGPQNSPGAQGLQGHYGFSQSGVSGHSVSGTSGVRDTQSSARYVGHPSHAIGGHYSQNCNGHDVDDEFAAAEQAAKDTSTCSVQADLDSQGMFEGTVAGGAFSQPEGGQVYGGQGGQLPPSAGMNSQAGMMNSQAGAYGQPAMQNPGGMHPQGRDSFFVALFARDRGGNLAARFGDKIQVGIGVFLGLMFFFWTLLISVAGGTVTYSSQFEPFQFDPLRFLLGLFIGTGLTLLGLTLSRLLIQIAAGSSQPQSQVAQAPTLDDKARN